MMNKELADFLSARREIDIIIGDKTVKLRMLTAREMLNLRAEVGECDALYANAALTAECIFDGGRAVFSNAEQVMDMLTAEEIGSIAESYCAAAQRFNPGAGSERGQVEQIKKA